MNKELRQCKHCGYYEDNIALHYEDCLMERIRQWNEIKYGTDNGDRIVVCTLKPQGTVTTALKIKE